MSAMLTSPVSSGSVYAFKTCIISVFGHHINCSIIKVFPKYCNVTQQISEVLSTIRFNFLCQGGATNLFIRLRVLLFFCSKHISVSDWLKLPLSVNSSQPTSPYQIKKMTSKCKRDQDILFCDRNCLPDKQLKALLHGSHFFYIYRFLHAY